MQQAIEASVQTDKHRQDVFEMRRTIADELKEEGAKEGALKKSQQTLIRLAIPYQYETKTWSSGRGKVLNIPIRGPAPACGRQS